MDTLDERLSGSIDSRTQAILLAGGRGERLRPLTDSRPKPMIEVDGVPVIAYALGWLRKNDVMDVVISCGYRWEQLRAFIGDGSRWGMRVRYAVERERLGRGGGARLAMRHLDPGDEPVVVANADNLVDICLRPILEQHVREGGLATLVVVPLVSARGVVELDELGRVTGFREKPELPYWVNAGIYVFSRAVEALLPARGDHEDEMFPALAAAGQLRAYPTSEPWRTIDTLKDVTQIATEIANGLDLPRLTV